MLSSSDGVLGADTEQILSAFEQLSDLQLEGVRVGLASFGEVALLGVGFLDDVTFDTRSAISFRSLPGESD